MNQDFSEQQQAAGARPVQVATFGAFQVNQQQTFDVLLAPNLQLSNLLVSISNPVIGALDKQISADPANSSKCKVSFRAPIVGLYTISVDLSTPASKPQAGVSFQAKAYDLSKVLINDSSGKCYVNESYQFAVDASEAGEGRLEIAVNEGEIPNQVQVLDNGKCIVNFVPEESVPHIVDIKFNGHNVNGCPFVVEVLDPHGETNKHVNGGLVQQVDAASSKSEPSRNPILIKEERIILNSMATFALQDLSLTRKIAQDDILIFDPENQQIDYKLIEVSPQAHYKFEFLPSIVGDYTIELKPKSHLIDRLPEEILEQFPLSLKVFDHTKVLVSDVTDGVIGHPVYFFIDASQAGSGNLEIRVSSTTRNVPNNFQSEANAIIRVHFTPTEAVEHTIDVKFNGISVPNNPFLVQVSQYPQARITLTSSELLKLAAINEQVNFDVEYLGTLTAQQLLPSNCQVSITAPDSFNEKLYADEVRPADRADRNPKFKLTFRPTKIGPHSLFITVNNQLLPGSPIVCNVYNVNEVKITCDSLETSATTSKSLVRINAPVTFTIDASRAGEGNLVLFVVSGSNRKPVEFEVKKSDSKQGLCFLTFVPTEFATHSINVSFNDRVAPNSPFIVEVLDSEGRESSQVQETQPTSAPKTDRVVKQIAENLEGMNISKSSSKPIKSNVKPAKAPVVSREDEILQNIEVHGISLKKSPVNSTGAFIIETNRMAHANDFDVLITDSSNNLVEVSCYLQQDGNLLAKWTPRRVGSHKIEVLYKDRQVPGSPFLTQAFDPSSVILEPIKLVLPIKINDKIEVKLDRREAGESADLDVVVTNSNGKEIPVSIDSNETGDEIIAFTPQVSGIYKLSVTLEGYEVPKSPLVFSVRDEIDPVKVAGAGLRCAEVNRNAQFSVDTSADGELKIRIENGNREIVPKVEKQAESYIIKYKPTEVGYATISLYWNGVHIENSPYTVPINDLSRIQILNGTQVTPTGNFTTTNQLSVAYEPRVKRQISVDTTKCGPGELKAEAYCRANSNLKFSVPVSQVSQGIHKLNFICPPEPSQVPRGLTAKDFSLEATYLLRFYYNNLNVPETLASVKLSPMQAHHSSLTDHHQQVAKQSELDGHHNNRIKQQATNGKFNQDEVVQPPVVSLRGHGLVEAKCGELAEFTIDGTKACEGKPEVRFSGAGNEMIKVRLEQIETRIYKATYIAEVAGAYSVNVLWDGKQVAGCPIEVSVTGGCDPTKVVCTADTLKGAILGEEIKTFIDTRKAGPGELTALCTGPTKVAFCELLDRGDGTFILYIKPQEAGRQMLTVKYGNQHIPKSPFIIKVSGQPDPTKVRVRGPGVEHGVLSLYQSRFVCDTRGAGAGQLTVRIRGPKGAFRMETQRESQRDRTILCKYDPTEPGDYRIEIKWSGRHVPGSPFSVMIFDTQEELNRFLLSQQRNNMVAGSQSSTGSAISGLISSSNNNNSAKILHPHQVPFQPTMVEYGQYPNVVANDGGHNMTKQAPYRLQ